MTLPNTSLGVVMLCHAQIADNFARDFAGQKNYQLNPKDMLQLAYSLLMIGNVTSAREVLGFMLVNHPGQAAAHYLSAHAANVSARRQVAATIERARIPPAYNAS